jgi:hypothetical protein
VGTDREILVILNNWQSFLTKLVPVFENLGGVMEIIAYMVLFILLPALVYSCKKSIDQCHTELKRQKNLLHSQTQTLSELNYWMQYFDEKMIKRENKSLITNDKPRVSVSVDETQRIKDIAPKKHEPLPVNRDNNSFESPPVSIYKKTI